MLLIVRPAQSAGQFQIGRDIVIGLAKTGIGIQHIRILAEEIIVTLIVQLRDRIGIDIAAAAASRTMWRERIDIHEPAADALAIVGKSARDGVPPIIGLL